MGKSYFKALCYFQCLACPSTAKGSPPERRTLLGSLFPAQISPGGTEASTPAWPLRRRRTHAPPDSCSHWLLPVANPRDRRRRAPPPAPPPRAPAAPALRRVPAGAGRAGLPAVARPPRRLQPALGARPPAPGRTAPTRWQCRAAGVLAGFRAGRAGRPEPARPSCKSFNEHRPTRAWGAPRPAGRAASISEFLWESCTLRWRLSLSSTQRIRIRSL